MAIRTLILSDIRLFRDGLERILSEEPQIDVILTTPNSAEAFEAVLSFAPDIVLIDLSTMMVCLQTRYDLLVTEGEMGERIDAEVEHVA